jgi:hypothetical protein
MKKKILSLIFILAVFCSFSQKINFDKYFYNKTMRVDYSHVGNNENEEFYLQEIKEEAFWGGSHKNLIDTFFYGGFMINIYNKETNALIYSRGFNSLFQEWQSTDEAKKVQKSFYEVAVFPYPKNDIIFEISVRNKKGGFDSKFKTEINPNSYFIKKEKVKQYETFDIVKNGDAAEKVDIVFIFDGYTKDEQDKLVADAERFAGYFFDYSPFKENKEKFNIHAIKVISEESGTDIPGKDIWKNTAVNSTFYTFDSERYLTTSDIKTLRDIASLVPYDQIFLIVNTAKYGGGGIYNYWSITCADDALAKYVFLHEFGHGFGGLADEYYNDDVAVEDYYPADVEPWEPNITNLVDFEKKQWSTMIDKKTPRPTPPEEKYYKTVGLFEGGGYIAKGMYRPYYKCEMKTLMVGYCPVCNRAILDMINFYSE